MLTENMDVLVRAVRTRKAVHCLIDEAGITDLNEDDWLERGHRAGGVHTLEDLAAILVHLGGRVLDPYQESDLWSLHRLTKVSVRPKITSGHRQHGCRPPAFQIQGCKSFAASCGPFGWKIAASLSTFCSRPMISSRADTFGWCGQTIVSSRRTRAPRSLSSSEAIRSISGRFSFMSRSWFFHSRAFQYGWPDGPPSWL